MRVGQKNGLVYQWAKKGARPPQPKDQRYANAYVFGAVCPARDTGAALVLPFADTAAMQLHLNEISRRVAAGAHAVLILDKAGWHTTHKLRAPGNISLLHLPSASPELNPTENIWQFYARPISPIACSRITRPSSRHPAQLGINSSPRPAALHASPHEVGQLSVKVREAWYKAREL